MCCAREPTRQTDREREKKKKRVCVINCGLEGRGAAFTCEGSSEPKEKQQLAISFLLFLFLLYIVRTTLPR